METGLVVNGAYCRIDNGGVSFGVIDVSGPTINIQSSHFGHLTNHMQVHVTKDGLRKLGEMFLAAAEHKDYSPDYACVADTKAIDKDTGKLIEDTLIYRKSGLII